MRKLKVLILEDDMVTANDIKLILIKEGFAPPKICRNTDDAIDILQKEIFDIAILDIELKSERNGIDLAKHINDTLAMPFIFLTSHDDDLNFSKAMETKPSAYLIKPFKPRELSFQIQVAYENGPQKTSVPQTFEEYLFLPTYTGVKKISKEAIVYLNARKSLTDIYLEGCTTPERFSINIGFLEQFLGDSFIRISRSNIINIKYMEELASGYLILRNLSERINLPVSNNSLLMNSFPIIRRK